MSLAHEAEVVSLVQAGALVAVNHSGGKDSQAMLELLRAMGIPCSQLVVVHAALGEVEWHGALEHAEKQARAAGIEFVLARARKTFLEMVTNRFATRPGVPSWPSSDTRQCTSDLKRGPIQREVRRIARERGCSIVVNAMGMRAEESSARAKKVAFVRNASMCVAKRDWYDWLPIHHLTTREVFDTIASAGQQPHAAYLAGNQRLSCVFCIMGSGNDARVGAIHRPELFEQYVELERRTGYTMHQSRRSLEVVAGITVAEAREANRHLVVLANNDSAQRGAA